VFFVFLSRFGWFLLVYGKAYRSGNDI
jgi:hypothetical protein